MQLKYLYPKLVLLLTLMGGMAACGSAEDKSNEFPSPASYDLNNPVVYKLPDRLNEVSGLAYYTKDSGLFAVVDEVGVLYKLMPGNKSKVEVQQWKFGKSSDYEDLVLIDSVFYVMKSKGDIVAMRFHTPDSISAEEFDIPLTGKNEFEILYFDKTSQKLVLICKDCENDDETKVSTWTFDPALKAFAAGGFQIDPSSVLEKQKVEEKRFKPSAAALHPLTGELYIVSSINKTLVIADRQGKIKNVYSLDPERYKQPEGIAFTPNGDMYISNESAGEGLPNLMFYPYKKAANEK